MSDEMLGNEAAGNEAAANKARTACERSGAARVHVLKFDVADPEACAKAVEEVAKELAGLHVLVNNAGISIDGLILRYKAEDLRRVLDVDLASAFHLSKAASLAREVGSRNIRVNAVRPGWIETDMTRDLPEQAKKAMIEGAALGRAGPPREVAEAIAFLASDRSSFMTGECCG
jgi:3-oxoacyl-[acyl-carrier protein] reductase